MAFVLSPLSFAAATRSFLASFKGSIWSSTAAISLINPETSVEVLPTWVGESFSFLLVLAIFRLLRLMVRPDKIEMLTWITPVHLGIRRDRFCGFFADVIAFSKHLTPPYLFIIAVLQVMRQVITLTCIKFANHLYSQT